jgi:peptidoglycan hydrolase CwlO-like protein
MIHIDDKLAAEFFELLLGNQRELRHIHKKLDQIIEQGAKMSQEVDDLNAKLDAQDAAIAAFTTSLQSATDGISTEIKQLADLVASSTDLPAIKAAVAAAATRVSGNTDAITAASATLATDTAALAADDPTPPAP